MILKKKKISMLKMNLENKLTHLKLHAAGMNGPVMESMRVNSIKELKELNK